MSIEAMKQALEALKSCSGVPHWPALQPAITALHAAIEQAEKPVATVKLKIEKRFIRGSDMGLGCSDGYVTNRYLTLEFINYNMNDPEKSCFKDGDVLYTTPPAAPRPWVGLTDEEIRAVYGEHHDFWDDQKYAFGCYERAIEAKLKERNT